MQVPNASSNWMMSPEDVASMQSRIESWIDELEHCLRVEGAKSRKKGVLSSMDEQLVVETTMSCMIDA